MKEFLILVGLVLAVAVAAIWGYFTWNYPSASLRYQITVEVEVDGQIYTGSGVHELTRSLVPNFNGGGTQGRQELKGDAVAVEIIGRGTLFVLLTGPCDIEQTTAFRPACGQQTNLATSLFQLSSISKLSLRSMQQMEARVEVPVEQMPLLVRFDDLLDPSSVEHVDPRDLGASFGEGVQLRSIWVETTNRGVTRTIEGILPWIPDYAAGQLDGHRSRSLNRGFANSLSTVHLKR